LIHWKVGDPNEFKVRSSTGLLEELVLVGKLLRQLQPQRANPLIDPLGIMVPLLGRAKFGSDDDNEVFGHDSGFERGLGGKLRFNRIRQRSERWVCLQ